MVLEKKRWMLRDNEFFMAKKKKFLCFNIDLKMLYELASKQSLFSTFLIPVIPRTEQRFCRQSSYKSQTTGFNLQGG